MSEKDNLKSKTASLSTDAEKKTTAKTAVKKSAGTAGKALKADVYKRQVFDYRKIVRNEDVSQPHFLLQIF